MKDMMNGPDVDRLLESLRAETPEVPADFHASWMKAVRAEAETAGANAAKSDPAAAGTAAAGAKKSPRRGTGQWARLASLAAALIVLIGGTLATRGRWTVNRETAPKAMKSESRAAETEAAALPAATELPLMQAESDAAPAPVMMSAAREAAESDMAAEEAAFEETAAEDASLDTAAAKNAAGEAAAANDAPVAMASDTGASAAAPGFFEDLGQFIAHRWYLPVGAGLLAAVLLRLCRKKTR